MIRLFLFLFINFFSFVVIAQTISFSKLLPTSPMPPSGSEFENRVGSVFEIADLNQDGYKDVIYTGATPYQEPGTFIYLNDGNGVLNQSQSFNYDLTRAEIIVFDCDNDNDTDFIISGMTSSNNDITLLFKNNGSGNFSSQGFHNNTSSYRGKTIVSGDIDKDGDIDVVMFELNNSSNYEIKVLLNNGLGQFVKDTNSNFNKTSWPTLELGDVNGDNYLDLIISGSRTVNNNIKRVTELYLSDSTGTFHFDSTTNLDGVYSAYIQLFDVDNDQDLDLLTFGLNNQGEGHTAYYLNDGSGSFTKQQHSILDMRVDNLFTEDFNNDGFRDILISNGFLYLNDGQGDFNITPTNIDESIKAAGDINNDGLPDIILNSDLEVPNYLYINIGNLTFVKSSNSVIHPLDNPTSAIGDFNNDGLNDIFYSGKKQTTDQERLNDPAYIYINTLDSNRFIAQKSTSISGLGFISKGFAVISDINNDGKEDITFGGTSPPSGFPGIYSYVQDTNGNFLRNFNTGLYNNYTLGVYHNNEFEHIDLNGDGLLDFFNPFPEGKETHVICLNNGNLSFSPYNEYDIPHANFSSFDFSDIDRDGDLDLIYFGEDLSTNEVFTSLYINNGNARFTLSEVIFEKFKNGVTRFIDVNHDGFDDIIIMAKSASSSFQTTKSKFYINDKQGGFDADTSIKITPLNGSLNIEDLNNDYADDIISSGIDQNGSLRTIIYQNLGQGQFKKIEDSTIYTPVYKSSISTGDLNSDGKKDIVICGDVDTSKYEQKSIADVIINQTSLLNINLRKDTSCKQFIWTRANLTINETGRYRDTAWAGNLIDNIEVLDITINKINTSLKVNQDTLFTSNVDSIYWYKCNVNSVDSLVHKSSNLNYMVVKESGMYKAVLHKKTCIDTTSCVQVNLYATSSKLGIVPNPSSNYIKINKVPIINNSPLQIYNVNGIKVKELTNYQFGQKIDISAFKSGIYSVFYQGKKEKFIIVK